MKYEVVSYFEDLQDNSHVYNVGDIYPRKGLKVTDERIAELKGTYNLQKKSLITDYDEVKEKKESKSDYDY